MGGLQQYANSSSAPLVSQYSIDNGPRVEYAPASPEFYSIVPYFQSPSLEMREHVLLMINMADNDLIWLDYFVIAATDSSGAKPFILVSDGALVPLSGSPQSPTLASTATRNAIVAAGTPSLSTSTVTATLPIYISQISSNPDPQTSQQSDLTSVSSHTILNSSMTSFSPVTTQPALTNQPTIIDYQNTSGTTRASQPMLLTKRTLVAVIVGSILGLIIIFILFITYIHRRRQKARRINAILDPYIESDDKASSGFNPSYTKKHHEDHSLGDVLGSPLNDSTATLTVVQGTVAPTEHSGTETGLVYNQDHKPEKKHTD
ncbi:hypothetical protein CVT24_007683 [Panaeolus cyanescens]|uniref:Uncharacterized protein n=1 Tax=Panaeolus cyanescens TaxID=181874 RepID=A0A409VRJ0_9AGAR|nr:hypothetical protein CVT24_007683 [Panaeolus cyanescens]